MLFNWIFISKRTFSAVTSNCPLHSLAALYRSPLLQKLSIHWGRNLNYFVVLFIKAENSHSAKCSFGAVRKDQSYSSRRGVHWHRYSALKTSPRWCFPRSLNQHTNSRAELFHYTWLTGGYGYCKNPCGASKEFSQMFLREKCVGESEKTAT